MSVAQVMEGFGFQVEVVKTDRKRSASIQLEGGLVKISVPKSLSDRRVRDLIAKRTTWIQTKLKELAERPVPKPKEFVSGEAFPYLGKNYRLKVIHRCDSSSIKLKSGYLITAIQKADPDPQTSVRSLLEGWYRTQATRRLKEKTERLAGVIGVEPKSVSVKNYKSRWGSCSARGDISYNWRIILAPHRMVDYVVVHELCHLLEHNHSPRYWRHVARHIPDWRGCRDWLKTNPIIF